MNKVNITSVGSLETYENNKKTPKHTSFKWNGDYDGKIANIDVRINNNGKINNSKLKLTNDELINMLSGPVDSKSIDERLFNDFLGENTFMVLSPNLTNLISPSNKLSVLFESDLAPFSTLMSSKTKKRRNKLKHYKNKLHKQTNKRKTK
jgi:hypothetical protein